MPRPHTPWTQERLLSRLEISPDPDGCWDWIGAKRLGYGRVGVEGRYWNAHRLAYTLFIGPIPGDTHVLHRCDNPACCNPAHLFLGTHSDNMQDREAKGRHNAPRGETHAEAKLTTRDVLEIRDLWRRGERPCTKIGTRFGISGTSAWRVATYKAWRHVP